MKIFLILFFVSILFISTKAQHLKLDSDFGKNGVLALLDQKWAPGITPNLFYFGSSYYLISSREVDSLHYLTIAKITKEGILDDSYFHNGINNTNINLAQIDSFESTIQRIFFYLTTDGNLYILAHVFHRSPRGQPSSKIVIFKLNLDGELDLSFGTNGYFWIGDKFHTDIYGGIFTNSGLIYINYASRDSGFVFTGNSIILKLDTNGNVDLKFGLNGKLELPQRSNIFIFNDLLLISATKDSLISLSGYNLDGILDSSFGINGTSTINFLHNTEQKVESIFQINDNLYMDVSARASQFTARGILKLNSTGHIMDDFGNKGYVSLIDTAFSPVVNFTGIVSLEKFIVGIGRGRSPDNYNVFTALIDYNGKFCIDSNSCWQRSFDSLDFSAYLTYKGGSTNLNNDLFVIGAFNARFGRPQSTVILKFIIDEVVSNNEFTNFHFSISPNPVYDYLIVHAINDSVKNSSYHIYNISGELVLNSKFVNADTKINVSDIPDGMYFLKVYSKGLKKHSVHKFIKS